MQRDRLTEAWRHMAHLTIWQERMENKRHCKSTNRISTALYASQRGNSKQWAHHTLIPRFSRGLGSKTSCEKYKSANPPPPKQCYLCFFIFFFSFQKHCDGSCFFFSLNSLNIIRYGSQTFSSCRTILMLLSIKGPGDVLPFLGQPREIAKLRTK